MNYSTISDWLTDECMDDRNFKESAASNVPSSRASVRALEAQEWEARRVAVEMAESTYIRIERQQSIIDSHENAQAFFDRCYNGEWGPNNRFYQEYLQSQNSGWHPPQNYLNYLYNRFNIPYHTDQEVANAHNLIPHIEAEREKAVSDHKDICTRLHELTGKPIPDLRREEPAAFKGYSHLGGGHLPRTWKAPDQK